MFTSLVGVDFTCAPSRRKPIVVARGTLHGSTLRLDRLDALPTLADYASMLAEPGPWLGAFDFPFGLPRVFVDALELGATTAAVSAEVHRRCSNRMALRALVDAWGNGREAGQRLVHRATDTAMAGVRSTSPLQTRYVPVGFMWYEGLSRLLAAGVHLPGQHDGDAARVAVEAYPGWVAHTLVGRRSYKNSALADRLITRKDLVDALEQGRCFGIRLKLTHAQHESLVADASGDRLDSALCLLQAGLAATQPGFALPSGFDGVEGWIVGT